MVMEDAEVPHHMLLIRNFMSQGLVHNQPLLYASPSKDPRQFLGTLPCPALPKDDKSSHRDPDQGSERLLISLLSVKVIPDKDKELEKLLTGNMVGLLNVHKVARINTQVPVILESTTFSINLKKRRFMVLECLNQVPIDGSSGSSYGTSSSCSVSSKTGTLDF